MCLLHKEDPLINNDLRYLYIHLLKNCEFDIINRENELIEKEIIIFLKSEREKLLEIIPGKIFSFISNNKDLNSKSFY